MHLQTWHIKKKYIITLTWKRVFWRNDHPSEAAFRRQRYPGTSAPDRCSKLCRLLCNVMFYCDLMSGLTVRLTMILFLNEFSRIKSKRVRYLKFRRQQSFHYTDSALYASVLRKCLIVVRRHFYRMSELLEIKNAFIDYPTFNNVQFHFMWQKMQSTVKTFITKFL